MERLRLAGFNERRCIARDSLSLYGTIVTLGTYISSTSQETLSKELVYKTLKQCIANNPILGVIIRDSHTEKPWLARASTVDLAQHVHFEDPSSSVSAFLEKVHSTPVWGYETRPQWDVYIQVTDEKHFNLAFASSHALADGRSGYIFHKSFLTALQNVSSLPFSSESDFPIPLTGEIQPPVELAGKLTISWSFLLGPLLNEYMPPWLTSMLGLKTSESTDQTWTGSPTRPQKPPNQLPPTALHTLSIPPTTLTPVLTLCRTHNSRLTGLLLHLFTQSLSRALPSQSQTPNLSFKTTTALDLRRPLPSATTAIANYASSTTLTLQPTPFSWPSISKTTTHLQTASTTLTDQPIGLLKYLTAYRPWTEKRAAAPADTSFEISNLGVFDATPSESWAVESMMFSQSADATGSPFTINMAGTKGGALSIVVSWWPGMLGVEDERKLIRDMSAGVEERLLELSEGGVEG